MTYPRTDSWRDDLDLEPNTHPTIAYALQHMRTAHAAQMAQRWPFPSELIPADKRKPPPTSPDPEPAPW